jgi:hypothetical protein
VRSGGAFILAELHRFTVHAGGDEHGDVKEQSR